MKGFYFINTDIRNTRAHISQILNTSAAINQRLPIEIVAPKYHDQISFDAIKKSHDLPVIPGVTFLRNFGLKESGIATFVLFNLPAIFFLINKKFRNEIAFIYIRSSHFLPLAIIAHAFGIPCFYETHRKAISLSERWRDYFMSNLSTGIVVISGYVGQYYSRYQKKILVAHDAVLLKRFVITVERGEARKKLGLPLDKPLCVYTGTVSKLKGMETLIAAASNLPNIDFLLVGSISKEFSTAIFPSNVKLLGRKDQNELPFFLRSANVLLLPHPKNEYSQSPMKLFEYMASGVPIVASNLPSISEILNDKNAVLVEADSERALVAGIEKILGDAHLSQAIAEKAYNDVQNYTWDKRGESIAKFILKIIKLKQNHDHE